MAEIWKDNYIVPLYQRNFAWGQEQIDQLFQDIYDSFKNGDTNYYVGSLVVVRRSDGTYEVIDGQQRLTVLSLICKKFEILNESHLFYDSRQEVLDFFNKFFDKGSVDIPKIDNENAEKIAKLLDAVDIVNKSEVYLTPNDVEPKSISNLSLEEIKKLKTYISNNVILIQTELPDYTDVAAYFEIMNNRGEQLQEHEIVKALMMENLKEGEKKIFADVWDACSQMNVPIQTTLPDLRKKNLFGGDFKSLRVEILDAGDESGGNSTEKTIDEIIADKDDVDIERQVEYVEEKDDEKYEAIIDFPNFLMHLFKMILEKDDNNDPNKAVKGTKGDAVNNDEIPLNADKLLVTYKKYEKTKDPMDFVKRLLKCRVLFDRYVIKNQGSEDDVENVKWILKRPYCYKDALKYKNTFSTINDTEEVDDTEDDIDVQNPDSQARIIKQQSMLQVTFRQRKYKNWVFEFLKWMMESDGVEIGGSQIIDFLDGWMESYYKDTVDKNRHKGNFNLFNAGVHTPHFLFNFIDYLYWVEKVNGGHNIKNIDLVEDFDFKYYNSVEHHLPQSYENNISEKDVNNIGNLCLISRGANSSLNDKGPTEKTKNKDKNKLSPKRKIMYDITDKKGKWGVEQILEHGNDIKELLFKYKEILNIS